MRVIMFGSGVFTPGDLPAGATFSRSSISALWAGSTTDGYDNLAWRASTDWSNGFYIRSDLSNGTWGSAPAVLQDSSSTSGAQGFTGWNRTKVILGRVTTSALPDNALISYVRVWASTGGPGVRYDVGVRAYWEVIGSRGDASSSIIGGASGDLGYFIQNGAILTTSSSKLATSPYGGSFTGAVLKATGFGVAQQPSSQNGEVHIYEIGIEVGYDFAPFTVTTGGANLTGATTANLLGTVNPSGDTTASYWMEYGLTPALGTATSPVTIPTGALTNASVPVSGLTAGATYYYRLVGQGFSGAKYYGETKSFAMGATSLPIYVL